MTAVKTCQETIYSVYSMLGLCLTDICMSDSESHLMLMLSYKTMEGSMGSYQPHIVETVRIFNLK